MYDLEERFEFRNITQEEADQAVKIEEICFRRRKHVRNK